MASGSGSGAVSGARPLEMVRYVYECWNAGSVARASALLDPDVRWESFGTARPVKGPQGLSETLAGTGGTLTLSPLAVDLLVQAPRHVLACTRRSPGAPTGEAERFEVWTIRDGRVTRYRGFPLEEGLSVLTRTIGNPRVSTLCSDVVSFNRGQRGLWPARVAGQHPGARLDDLVLLTEGIGGLAITAMQNPGGAAPLHLVLVFEREGVAAVTGYGDAQTAIAAAAAPAAV